MDVNNYVRLSELDLKNNIGNTVTVICLLSGYEQANKKTGEPYAKITLMDKDINMLCQKWTINDNEVSYFTKAVGQLVIAEGNIKAYDKSPNGVAFHITEIGTLDLSTLPNIGLAIEDFYNIVASRDELIAELNDYLVSIKHTYYGKLAIKTLQNNWNIFIHNAAGKSMHHTSIGGLLQHSIEVIKIAENLYNSSVQLGYKTLNRALIIAGAAIHDIGKCKELATSISGTTEYTASGQLEPHSVSGLALLTEAATQLELQNTAEFNELYHIILSHHGRTDWGAIKEPAMPEATIVSQADWLSCVLNSTDKYLQQTEPGASFNACGNYWVHSIGCKNDEIDYNLT